MGNATTQSTLQLQAVTKGVMRLEVVEVAGEVWFYAPSLAAALGYAGQEELLRQIPDDEQVTDSLRIGDNEHQAQFLLEPGFYRAVFYAKTDIAEPLKRWITQEVLPAIRKTGQYMLHKEARRLGVTLNFSAAQWAWIRLHPYMVDVLPLAAAGFNSVEITRALHYSTPSGITARKRIERLKEVKLLPAKIEPRAKQLERLIADESVSQGAPVVSKLAQGIDKPDRTLLDAFHAAPLLVQIGVQNILSSFTPKTIDQAMEQE